MIVWMCRQKEPRSWPERVKQDDEAEGSLKLREVGWGWGAETKGLR